MRRIPGVPGSAIVAALAVIVRVGVIVSTGGGPLGGYDVYDAGVYYTAADALVHGRLPYRDFVLLHPPGLMLALTPFAALGSATSDHAVFVLTNVVFTLLGAVNAVLVVRVARQLGVPERAALLGGAFYAVWFTAAIAEMSARLEPLGNFALLCGLLVLTRHAVPSRRSLVLAGAAFGYAAAVKLWWVVPLAVAVVWLAAHRPRLRAAWFAGGAAAVLLVVNAVFFLAAPSAMWRMVVSDQLRRRGSTTTGDRFAAITSLSAADGHLPDDARALLAVLVGILLVALVVAAWRVRPARLVLVIGAAQFALLMVTPTYFGYYGCFLAPSLAITVAAAAGSPTPRRVRGLLPAVASLAVGVAAIASAVAIGVHHFVFSDQFPRAALAGRIPSQVHCLISDSTIPAIELDRLSEQLARGCPDLVDVSGYYYDVSSSAAAGAADRARSPAYQHGVRCYLLSGDAVMIVRPATGLSSTTKAAVYARPILVTVRGRTIHLVAAAARCDPPSP